MQTMYVLQGKGLVDDEYAYENIGVYSSRERAENALQNFTRDIISEGCSIETRIEEFELDA
jgi:uncharacterized protein YfcZ (UPF0381/DUF406 family)